MDYANAEGCREALQLSKKLVVLQDLCRNKITLVRPGRVGNGLKVRLSVVGLGE